MLALSQNPITDSDDVTATLGRVTHPAVDLTDGVDYADVMLIQHGRFWSVAPTDHPDPPVQRPSAHERWPTFSGAAQAAGVRGVRPVVSAVHQSRPWPAVTSSARPKAFS